MKWTKWQEWGVLVISVLLAFRSSADMRLVGNGVFVTRPRLQGASGVQTVPGVCSNGKEFLAAWIDTKSTTIQSDWEIWCARVTQDGVVLDPEGLMVARSPVFKLASDGQDFLVTWRESLRIYAVRVSREGKILDPAPIWINQGPGEDALVGEVGVWYSVVGNKNGYLFIWSVSSGGNVDWDRLIGRRLEGSGALLDQHPISIGTTLVPRLDLTLGTDGEDYFALWTEKSNGWPYPIRIARIQADGTVLDPDGVDPGLPNGYQPYPVWTGSNFIIFEYIGDVANSSRRLVAGVLQGTQVQRTFQLGPWRLDQPVAALTPHRLLFRVQPDDGSQPTQPSGLMDLQLGPDTFRVHTLDSFPPGAMDQYASLGTAFTPDAGLLTYIVQGATSDYDVMGRLIDLNGDLAESDDFPISTMVTTPSAKQSPVIASNGNNELLAWLDANASTIEGAWIQGGDKPTVSTNFPVSEVGAFQAGLFRVVACRTNYLAIYGSNSLSARPIQPDTGPRPVTHVDSLPINGLGAASNGDSCLVVFESGGKIYGRTLSPEGVPLGLRIGIAAEANALGQPAVASDGQGYLATWSDRTENAIRAAYIDAAGTVTPTNGILVAEGTAAAPVATFDGTRYLVAWARDESGIAKIQGRYFAPGMPGPLSDIFAIGTGSPDTSLDVASAGVKYPGDSSLLVWERDDQTTQMTNLSVARVVGTGDTPDITVIPLDAIPVSHAKPSIAYIGSGEFLIASQSLLAGTQITGRVVSIFEPLLIVGKDVYVLWKSDTPGSVQVQASPTLSEPDWTPIDGAQTGEGLGFVKDPDGGGATHRFYRFEPIP